MSMFYSPTDKDFDDVWEDRLRRSKAYENKCCKNCDRFYISEIKTLVGYRKMSLFYIDKIWEISHKNICRLNKLQKEDINTYYCKEFLIK